MPSVIGIEMVFPIRDALVCETLGYDNHSRLKFVDSRGRITYESLARGFQKNHQEHRRESLRTLVLHRCAAKEGFPVRFHPRPCPCLFFD